MPRTFPSEREGEAVRAIAANFPVIYRRSAIEQLTGSPSQTGSSRDDCATSLSV